MSENQGKPKKKVTFNGITIGFLLIIILLLLVLAYTFSINIPAKIDYNSCNSHCTGDCAYTFVRADLESAVLDHVASHNGTFPTLNSTYSNNCCQNCSVINISALLAANGGMLREAPDCLNLSASGNDNCGGNSSLGCNKDGSYIWLIDDSYSVASYCAGVGCVTNNTGLQGIWP
jgi:hypothetical protein